MKLTTHKDKGNIYAIDTIVIHEYDKSEIKQLIGLLNSYDCIYPWYQTISNDGNSWILLNFHGVLNTDILETFDYRFWENHNIKEII